MGIQVFTPMGNTVTFTAATTAPSYGTVGVAYEAGSPYTPYADLTQDQVIGWVQAAMGAEQVASIEAGLATNIADQINPPVVTPKLPWSA